jgi:hypothetical protein
MNDEAKERIAQIIADAPEVEAPQEARHEMKKPRLLVDSANPDRTVAAMRDILAADGRLFDRGGPVQVVQDVLQQTMTIHKLTTEGIVMMVHSICRPYFLKVREGQTFEVDCRLPTQIATMYLHWSGNWQLRALDGICSSPLMRNDGSVHVAPGYDQFSRLWLEGIPDVGPLIPQLPTESDAQNALRHIRERFRTFCFADAKTLPSAPGGEPLIDLSYPPGQDESAFLTALVTAVSRSSLDLAPGILIRAASMSGAGAGKGLLARCICEIAFGHEPFAVTSGESAEELEKRIAAELMAGSPVLFLDNHNRALKSDQLASAITEHLGRIRPLGSSKMVALKSSAFVVVTGNGLTVSEDLARRFIPIELDPRTEEPEARSITTDVRAEVKRRRLELLAAVLAILRRGRLQRDLPKGKALGSFEQWCRWVRDPLIALG